MDEIYSRADGVLLRAVTWLAGALWRGRSTSRQLEAMREELQQLPVQVAVLRNDVGTAKGNIAKVERRLKARQSRGVLSPSRHF